MFREFFVGFLSNLLGLTFFSTKGMKKEKQDKLDNILSKDQFAKQRKIIPQLSGSINQQ